MKSLMKKISTYYRRITALLPTEWNERGIKLRLFPKEKKAIAKSMAKHLKKFVVYCASLEKHYARYLLTVLVLFLFILSLQLYFLINEFLQVQNKRVETYNKLGYWESVVSKHSNFPDAYYEAAVYAYSLGDVKKAGVFLDKALFLDPLFKEAQELKKKLR